VDNSRVFPLSVDFAPVDAKILPARRPGIDPAQCRNSNEPASSEAAFFRYFPVAAGIRRRPAA
jgi:hypothetical protein